MKYRNDDTINAKIDIVNDPDNIRFYSPLREDYKELALLAIFNKPSTIGLIPSSYEGYLFLCRKAINEDVGTLEYIDYNISGYNLLAIIAINKNPYVVLCINKNADCYLYFWKLAISKNSKIIKYINHDKKELFVLLMAYLIKNPMAIQYVDTNISIYNMLCKIAYYSDKTLVIYMDINKVEKWLALEILKAKPEKIKDLDSDKEYYWEACKIAVSRCNEMLKYVDYNNDNIEQFMSLVMDEEDNSLIMLEDSKLIYALSLYNRKVKNSLLNGPNILGDNIYQLLIDLDMEYDKLVSQLSEIKKYELIYK